MQNSKSRQRTVTAGAGVAALGAAWYANDRYAISHDIKSMLAGRNLMKRFQENAAKLGDTLTLYASLQRFANKDAEALWFEGRTWTYRQLLMEVDKVATFLYDYGIRPDDVIAMFTSNSPEMIFCLIAIGKLGAVSALLNTSLRSQTLAHCLKIVKAKVVLSTADLTPVIADLFSESESQSSLGSIPCISVNLTSYPPLKIEPNTAVNITQLRYEDLAHIAPADYRPDQPIKRGPQQVSCYMYTSGSTGYPKAVTVRNIILCMLMVPSPADYANPRKYLPLRTYSCLPLFHATALYIGFYRTLSVSGTFCLSRVFSARRFSQELIDSRATRLIYVGELCRYALAAPPSPADKQNKVIVANGNGLKEDIWNKFRDRFGIPEIREFYSSTEGIAGFQLSTTRASDAGFVGRKGPIARYFEPVTYIVKYDKDSDMPWRNPKTGFCEQVAANEPGEAIGRVMSMDMYREYLDNPDANSKKLLKDVFKKGDLFQRTGDLLIRDNYGRIRFADRMGDTWRWQGENVSAGEVRGVISQLAEVKDANCYGVQLAGYDGQAGAAAITLSSEFQSDSTGNDVQHDRQKEDEFMATLYKELRRRGLTSWQVPRLVRLTGKIETTATFKHLINLLKERSWNPDEAAKLGDRVYWLDQDQYRVLDQKSWEGIEQAKARL